MPLITPRRRFLITAPLALLLPAGLLTYLGLEMVKGVESRYEQTAFNAVNNIVSGVRNRTTLNLNQKILTPFRYLFQDQMDQHFDTFPIPDDHTLKISERLTFASSIFVYGPDRVLYYYERDQKDSSLWRLSEPFQSTFTGRLKSELDIEIENNLSFLRINDGYPPSDEGFPFRSLPHPEDNLYPAGSQRELAFFFTLMPFFYEDNQEKQIPNINDLYVVGFTFDFDYLNNVFFNEILNEMWQDPEQLRYPVAIEDKVTHERVAVIENHDFNRDYESQKYHPQLFSTDFPWYRIHFSKYLEENIMGVAQNEKIIDYCLIATANLIMIIGVIGALRNILKELALSDMRSNFVARVSHELRTPLGLIRLYAETLEMDRLRDEKKRKEYLHSIIKESERLTNLINNILDFSRMEVERKDYAHTVTTVEDIIFESVDSMRYHVERHGQKLSVDVQPDLPEISCDPQALRQALYNLISNAIKYSGEGKEIQVNANHKGKYVAIEVIDQGIGILPEQQDKIFQEFYRVDHPYVRDTGGSGLGLAVVKHIVEGHRGYIDVKSQVGEGSTFTIYLPVHTS